ncbi:MAG: efflux RND transporter periplasmic adaptor subunit [Myxococcales bacterium]|nr:efflux RND transporter periplasmic adaptor subunit [Myxococcales bacterium]
MLASLVLAATACSPGDTEGPPPSVAVALGTLERIVVATGTLEPERMVDVRPRISGIVQKIYVQDGDLVKAGQILVEIDSDLLEVRLREVHADLETSKIEMRYAALAQSRADVLKQAGTMPDQEYDDTNARNERAVASVTRSKALVSRLEVELRYATVRAPMDGIILEIPIEEGSAVSSVLAVTGGTSLLTLASTTALHLEGQVDENEIARVVVGQPARIRTEAFGSIRTFAGTVRRISPIGTRVQNVTYFEVEVEVDDVDARGLLPRMSADADIVTEIATDVLWVPETALHYEGDEIYLSRAPTEAENPGGRLSVKLGIVEGDRVQLLSGAAEGDLVLLR